MEKDAPTAGQQMPETAAEPGADSAGRRISTGRMLRLAVLFLVLVGLIVASLVFQRRARQYAELRRQKVQTAVGQLRDALGAMSLSESGQVLRAVMQSARASFETAIALDAQNEEANRLGVPLFYAEGNLERAIELYNDLDHDSLSTEVPENIRSECRRAIAAFPTLTIDAAGTGIGDDGKRYLTECGLLHSISWVATAGAENDTDKALQLCRWMALHLLPAGADALAATPLTVIVRGYGSPEQLVWTYCELARQAGLCVRAVIPAGAGSQNSPGPMVQVRPQDGDAFLLDPVRGVPIVEPSTGAFLSLERAQRSPSALDSLVSLAGHSGVPSAEALRGASLKVAIHPYAVFPRFIVFDRLLAALPSPPKVGFDFSTLGEGERLDLWDVPVRLLSRMRSREHAAAAAKEYRSLEMIQMAREWQIRHLYGRAAASYAAAHAGLKEKLSETDVPGAAEVIRNAIDTVAFFEAVTAFDSGASNATELLQGYLKEHPSGRWVVLARAVLAEALERSGDHAAAVSQWQTLPPPRRIYGLLRARGILKDARPALPSAQPAATSEGRAQPSAAAERQQGTASSQPGSP